METVTVIGAGLAGSECAWQLARRGVRVRLVEMKPHKYTPAHKSEYFAELVCSNSLRGDDLTNAVGLLKEEMRQLGSLIMESAEANRVAAGGALAVDREGFARYITEKLGSEPNIEIVRAEAADIPEGEVVIATGPLTSDAMAERIRALCPEFDLHFYDAVAPIVTLESVDMTTAYRASRYGKGTADYVNCPMTAEEYAGFVRELRGAKEAPVHGFDDGAVFEGCMPVEVMARRGEDTLRYGPMKPVGLVKPAHRRGGLRRRAAPAGQRRRHALQPRRLPDAPHLGRAEARLLDDTRAQERGLRALRRHAPQHLSRLPAAPRPLLPAQERAAHKLRRADDRVEGYVESAASGLLVGIETAARVLGLESVEFPAETAVGALALYVSGGSVGDFQPMNINFGIITPLGYRVKGKRNKNAEISRRSLGIIAGLKEKRRYCPCEDTY